MHSFCRVQPWGSTSVIYIVVIQLAVALVSVVEAFGSNLDRDSCWLNFSAAFDRIGFYTQKSLSRISILLLFSVY